MGGSAEILSFSPGTVFQMVDNRATTDEFVWGEVMFRVSQHLDSLRPATVQRLMSPLLMTDYMTIVSKFKSFNK